MVVSGEGKVAYCEFFLHLDYLLIVQNSVHHGVWHGSAHPVHTIKNDTLFTPYIWEIAHNHCPCSRRHTKFKSFNIKFWFIYLLKNLFKLLEFNYINIINPHNLREKTNWSILTCKIRLRLNAWSRQLLVSATARLTISIFTSQRDCVYWLCTSTSCISKSCGLTLACLEHVSPLVSQSYTHIFGSMSSLIRYDESKYVYIRRHITLSKWLALFLSIKHEVTIII